jgi:hypothetical protein
MEHYARLAQNIIDESVACAGRKLTEAIRERPGEREEELVDRLMAAATVLAAAYVELLSWLENATGRKAGVLGTRRGAERLPRYPIDRSPSGRRHGGSGLSPGTPSKPD